MINKNHLITSHVAFENRYEELATVVHQSIKIDDRFMYDIPQEDGQALKRFIQERLEESFRVLQDDLARMAGYKVEAAPLNGPYQRSLTYDTMKPQAYFDGP